MKTVFGLGVLLYAFFLYAKEAPSANEADFFDTTYIPDRETQKSMQSWVDALNGLKPYRPNYLLPLSVGSGTYKNYTLADTYQKIEAELQVSLKLNIANNLFGLNESYNLSYTQTSFWQVYSPSAPFRETNYNPEFFVIFPMDTRLFPHLRTLTFALTHMSNGQGNITKSNIPFDLKNNPDAQPYLVNRSRSINYIYTKAEMQYENFLFYAKLWVPFFGGTNLSDNPDLMDYIGYTSFGLHYFSGKNLYTVDTRFNILTQKGAITSTYSYPTYEGVYYYIKFFTGYCESLIDYNNYITKLSIGFSFSR